MACCTMPCNRCNRGLYLHASCVQMEVQSFASRNQLAVTQTEIDKAFELEWDRRLITVLGAANNRLYEFRLQTANSAYEANSEGLLRIAESFKCRTVDV